MVGTVSTEWWVQSVLNNGHQSILTGEHSLVVTVSTDWYAQLVTVSTDWWSQWVSDITKWWGSVSTGYSTEY